MDPDRVLELLATLRELDEHERARRERLLAALRRATEGLAGVGQARTLAEAQEGVIEALRDVGEIVREP